MCAFGTADKLTIPSCTYAASIGQLNQPAIALLYLGPDPHTIRIKPMDRSAATGCFTIK
jgi:hypothetical protein